MESMSQEQVDDDESSHIVKKSDSLPYMKSVGDSNLLNKISKLIGLNNPSFSKVNKNFENSRSNINAEDVVSILKKEGKKFQPFWRFTKIGANFL